MDDRGRIYNGADDNAGGVAGLLVSLADDGMLTLSFLGTDPPSTAVSTEAKELNYEAMDEEHRRLLQIIREASAEGKKEPTDTISLRAQALPVRAQYEPSRVPVRAQYEPSTSPIGAQ